MFNNIEFIEKYKPSYKKWLQKEEYHSLEHALIEMVIHDIKLDFGVLTEKTIYNFQMEVKNRLRILNIDMKSLIFKERELEFDEFKKIHGLIGFLFPTKGSGGFYEFIVDTNIPKEK